MLARENPFRVERVHRIRYRFENGDPGWGQLLSRLEVLRRRGAIVGEKGRGKTTLLEELARRLEARGERVVLRRVTAERPRVRLAGIAPGSFVLVDGADLLSRVRWVGVLWATRRAGGLVVTSHREGLLPTLHRAETSAELLAGIVAEIDGSLSPPPDLFERSSGDVRAALRELYDVAARSSGPR